MKAIITAGGRGTRMRPLTFSSNKHLIPLANKPLIYYALESVIAAGITEIGINYNPGQKDELEAALGDGSKWGVRICYILQEKPMGLANIVQVSREFIGQDKFVMHLGDNIFYGGITDLVTYFTKSKSAGLLTIMHHPENRRLGVPYFDAWGRLVKYVEKPKDPPNDWAVPGLYFADERIFNCFTGQDPIKPSARGEYEIPAAFQWLIDHGQTVETCEFTGTWMDPGKFDDWLASNRFLLDHELPEDRSVQVNETVRVEGRVRIGKKCQITDSLLRGPVIIGDEVTIKGSVIGPFSSIGNGATISETRIENSVVMEKVTITNPGKQIDSSVIGQETIIERGSSIAGAVELFVGNQCTVKI